MKIRNVFAIAGFAFMLLIGFSGCETDLCKDVVCENGGTCFEGDCVCATGYEGTDCSEESRTKFVGAWTGTETCPGGTISFPCTISTSTAAVTRILFSNFADLNSFSITEQVYGEVNGDAVTIPSQTVGGGAAPEVTVVGSGSIRDGNMVIDFSYDFTDASGSTSCTAEFVPQ